MLRTIDDLIPAGIDPKEWPDIHVLAATLFGESRGEKLEVKLAVGCVIRNRSQNDVRWDGVDWKSTCLKDWQFSCWNKNDPNRIKLLRPLDYEPAYVWLDCLAAARIVME
ncbi:MAG: hypothetical protein ACRD1R_18585, partial [Acidobacteriota bacterium]